MGAKTDFLNKEHSVELQQQDDNAEQMPPEQRPRNIWALEIRRICCQNEPWKSKMNSHDSQLAVKVYISRYTITHKFRWSMLLLDYLQYANRFIKCKRPHFSRINCLAQNLIILNLTSLGILGWSLPKATFKVRELSISPALSRGNNVVRPFTAPPVLFTTNETSMKR